MSAHRRGQGAGRGRFSAYPHEYGPHLEQDAPSMVEVWVSKNPADGTELRPVADALVEQRRRLNEIAHEAARARLAAADDTRAPA